MIAFDHYTFRARLQPALVTLLPLATAALAWSDPGSRWLSVIWTVIGTSGATYLLANLARNRGKQIETTLWNVWGGAPTTQLLRHRGPANPHLREKWHQALAKLLGRNLPTREEEAADPDAADQVYAAATRLLINERRDAKAYPLVFKENVNYGFCRNLLAMKSLGIVCALAGATAATVAAVRLHNGKEGLPWACAALAGLLLLAWFIVTQGWVMVPAFAYAERLFESLAASPRKKIAKDRSVGTSTD